ncbi:hypothetical protein GCM10010310_72420 [Streptomyces violaceolatus]|uniref:Transposase n=1 Tax=Streptomyces violaceolatus TaxID=67378 RepID=A0ABN3TH25_9ACTN
MRWRTHHKRTRCGGDQRGITVRPAKAIDTLSRVSAQLSSRKWLKCSQPPKLMAQAVCSRAGRPSFLWVGDTSTAWLRPVGVRQGTRAPGRLANPPSWLTVVG